MNFTRSTLLVAGAAFLAACGDKVSVQSYTPSTPTPVVNSVSVAPATATLTVGQSITLTAAVNADAGLATTVTWSSSDASKASVTSAGVVSAVAATPGVAVCAASTVDAGKKGCASIVVSAPAPVQPASVSINSITVNGTNGTTVDPTNVNGKIDITLNVNPGNQQVSKIVLLVGGIRQDSQTFTAAQAAALRFSADQAVAAQSTFPQVLFSVNTAAFNATTGTPTWTNGAKGVSAQLYTVAGGTATAATATAQTNLTFANVDGFAITTSGGNSVVDANGYRWNGNGSLTVNAIPVMYSGASIGTVNASLGANGACTAVGSVGSATTKTGNAYVITGAMAGAQSPAGCTTTTPNMIIMTATNATGDNLTLAGTTGVVGGQTGLRWDNVAPAAPAGSTFAGNNIALRLNVNPNGRANAWINDAVVFNAAATSATSNNFICNASAAGFNTCLAADSIPRDAGVGGATLGVKVGATKAAAVAAAVSTSPAALAQTATNAGYCAIGVSVDALGNSTSLTSAQQATACGTEANNATIGVDRTAPTIAYSGGLAANARVATATIATEFSVTVNDTGLVGNSGMLPGAPVKMSISRRTAAATTLRDATGAATVTAISATGVVAAAPIYTTSFAAITGAANYGYWTHNATAFDAAGNSASVSPRVIVFDFTAPVPGATSVPLTVSAIGFNASALVNEDLDIQDYFTQTQYTGAPVLVPALIQNSATTAVNGFNAATFQNTNFAVTQAVNTPLAIQANVAAGLTNLTGVQFSVRSQANTAATSAFAAPVTITPGTAISTTNMTGFAAIAIPGGVTGVVTGNTTAAATATPASTTLTANIVGATAIFNNPFSRMDFYMLDATGARYILVGSASSATLNDNGATRTYTYQITISGATVYSLLGGAGATFGSQIVALGMNASGTIGMVPAALTAINVVF